MAQWAIPEHMIKNAGATVYNFGYDQQGIIEYKFNSLGHRSDEITNQPTLFTVGNSITFGIGINVKDTYGYQLAQHLRMPLANIANGCHLHENHEQIPNIDQIANRNINDIVIVQINNLSRRTVNDHTEIFYDPDWCVGRLEHYFDYVESALARTEHYYVYWDEHPFDIPEKIKTRLSIHNKFHLDHSLNTHSSFGIKSHRAIAKVLAKIIGSQRAQLV